jgi:hypothetical protein
MIQSTKGEYMLVRHHVNSANIHRQPFTENMPQPCTQPPLDDNNSVYDSSVSSLFPSGYALSLLL